MNAVVIEHVKVSELPEDWQTRLHASANACVTVRIEEEAGLNDASAKQTENPLFGMWQDREEIADIEGYVRKLRAPRF